MGTIYIACICFGIPLLGLYLLNRSQKAMIPFMVGMLVFFVSQILLRMPLLQILQNSISFQLFSMRTIPYLFFLSITAGLFEEVGRYVGFWGMKHHRSYRDAFAFGLGHGAMEAMLLVGLPLLQRGILPFMEVAAAGVERISAMMLHIALAILVYRCFEKKQGRYLLLAILLHTVYNFIAVVLLLQGVSVVICESLLLLTSFSLLFSECQYLIKERGTLK